MRGVQKMELILPPKPRINLKKAARIESGLTSGHRMCAGCGAGIVARLATIAGKMGTKPLVATNATGCLEVASTIYPYNAWTIPWQHNAFENAAAHATGAEAAFIAMKRRGGYEGELPDIIVFAGDGGTADIGIGSLSGAIERGHDFLYIMYNNGAYMNTGIQRSSATSTGAATTTSPGGKVVPGKPQLPKDVTRVMHAHNIPVFTGSTSYPQDFMTKVRRGLDVEGPAFMEAYSPCPLGHRMPFDSAADDAILVVETCMFPLYTAFKDHWELSPASRKIAKNPDLKKPVV